MKLNISQYANFIWSVADLLRGDYKQSDYGKVILPLTVLRRLDCDLEDTKEIVLKQYGSIKDKQIDDPDILLNKIAGRKFHNHSQFDFNKLIADPSNIAPNLRNYLNGFSKDARDIIENFEFDKQIIKLDKADLLYQVVKKFQEIDLNPKKVTNLEMGYIFEELIRKFAESSNETAGEHFTPREVIRLMVNLLFTNDNEILSKKSIVKTIYDPACGTGGMLTVAEDYLQELNPDARLELFGQEINPESYAICKSDMMVTGHNAEHIRFGDTLRDDKLSNVQFDYMLSNPPFGVKWNKAQKEVVSEHEDLGYGGRFGAGLPSISDGSLLFLQTMLAKMKPSNGGSRLSIVFNGSPLFTGSAGSGPSDIRKWIIENDLLEAIIALPDQLFYNTGISTYIWILTNRKSNERKGKIQLINAVNFYKKMSKSLGNKRHEIADEDIAKIVEMHGEIKSGKFSKIFDNEDFGYNQIAIERPQIDKNGKIITDKGGNPKPDTSLRDRENVPLKEDIHEYFEREVKPHVPDAWIDESQTKVGYEINFTKHFYEYKPLRSLEEITKDILELEKESDGLLKEILS
ncbi:MAG: n-6 DNA methylase [Candidatus Pacebacteria bacterium GW2011_GWB1_47_8]|nr:MAG: n-6 DNA methylase [Microgenomates group bacterium GW2011_GWC1_37_8]KKU18412.1 MAG: n-6 DNA methylase [Candidatus Pacebacteria bacterium GW2011_GWA1_46_10]KKU84208.1 MAG: n-6 DNA methylase [Candidatus Pacebacteria bacterium GW2011_GWB1_47_8]HCR81343.1 restriction endonuclease subunit M [Candidatus Paceibacterota bacterium]